MRVAFVAGAFVVLAAIFMAWDYGRRLAKDPLDSTEFKALKQRLADLKKQEPTEAMQKQIEETVEEIRAADLELRETYFWQRRFAARGAWILLGGLAVLIVAAKTAATLGRKLPMPEPQASSRDTESQMARIGRWSVAGLGVGLVGIAVALNLGIRSELTAAALESGQTAEVASLPSTSQAGPRSPNGTAGKTASFHPTGSYPAPTGGGGPSKEEAAKNWPRFRGPDGSGIAPYDNVPTKWDVSSGEGIAWKTPVPLEGNSSPVVWKDRVFLTGATEQKRQVYCFDAASGKLLWQKDLPGTPASAKTFEVNSETGFASSTPATDGRRVYAIFANGDLAAFDFAGNLAWSQSLGIPKNSYGHATSLVMVRNLLLVQMDQGSAKEAISKLIALDAATGKPVWEVKRAVPSSWCTPIVIEVKGREQIVTGGDPWAIAYDPADGKEIWRVKCLRQDVGPSPVFADGLVYAVNAQPQATAIRADGQGDVTASHIAWMAEDDLPDTCSPLATAQFVFLLTSSGTLTCHDAKAGKKLWSKDFEANFLASPSMAGKHLYLFSDEGKVFIVEPGPTECKITAEATMGEKCAASPAFQDGRIYVRTKSQLYCIGKK